MLITSVEKDEKIKDKYSVYVDDKFAFIISEEDYLRLGFYEKGVITEDEITMVKSGINRRSAMAAAIKYLAYKLRTENEVADKLREQGHEESNIEIVINDLKSAGYINDSIYAEKYINDRIKLKPGSKKLIQYELEQRGIKTSVILSVLDDKDIDEYSTAETLVKRKFERYNFNDEKTIKKIISFLQRRGFDYDIIKKVIKNVQGELNGESYI